MRFKEVEDIDLYVRNYQRNKDRIALCEREIEELEGEINSSNSIVIATNDQRESVSPRTRELFFRIDELMNRKAECEVRINAVHELLDYLKLKTDKIWFDIVELKIKGNGYEEISQKISYSTKSSISIQYWKGLESYLYFIKN